MGKNTSCFVLLLAVAVLLFPGCAARRSPARLSGHEKAAHSHSVDPKAQQRYYDLGLQQYSKENYAEARKAFQQAFDADPGSQLGIKAQENVRKTDQILKTLEEMERK